MLSFLYASDLSVMLFLLVFKISGRNNELAYFIVEFNFSKKI